MPEVAVPLATTTGWNFRAERIGNPTTIVALARLAFRSHGRAPNAQTNNDPRLSIAERYKDKDDYLTRIRAAAGAW